MKEKYEVKSERYNHVHSFIQIDGSDYKFVPEKDWMPLYVTYADKEKRNIAFIDTEGGPCIGKKWTNGEITVKEIKQFDNGIVFTLKENGHK